MTCPSRVLKHLGRMTLTCSEQWWHRNGRTSKQSPRKSGQCQTVHDGQCRATAKHECQVVTKRRTSKESRPERVRAVCIVFRGGRGLYPMSGCYQYLYLPQSVGQEKETQNYLEPCLVPSAASRGRVPAVPSVARSVCWPRGVNRRPPSRVKNQQSQPMRPRARVLHPASPVAADPEACPQKLGSGRHVPPSLGKPMARKPHL